MYQCSKCRHTMAYPHDRCPSCSVLLSGVRCQGCQYVGGKQEFIARGHRCPKCGSVVEIPTAAGSSGDSAGDCFVATTVYGDRDAPEVCALRAFRDRVLLPRVWGRACVRGYYRFGPGWAQRLRARPVARRLTRRFLDACVRVLRTGSLC